MGSQPSKVPVLTCPDNYDQNKFKKICSLFDKLDKDSNLGVSSDEIEQIAELHVSNCITHMEDQAQSKKKAFNVGNMQITLDEQHAQAKIKQEFDARREHERLLLTLAVQSLEKRIAVYNGFNKSDKANALMKAVMPKGEDNMDFWSFFEYMKNRTEDIQNIRSP
tara:strand:+ start:9344 stop:9838 length:495 start_codon:yes stop_codon:yes gene_type:complete